MPRNTFGYFWVAFAVATFIAQLSVAGAADGDFPAADKAVIKAYVLTVNKLNGYIAGTTALASAKNADDALAAEIERAEDEPGGTLAELRSKITRHPKVFTYFQRQGLSVDDAVLLPLAITYAGVAVSLNNLVPFADTTSQAQASFVRANPTLMQRFSEANDSLDDSR